MEETQREMLQRVPAQSGQLTPIDLIVEERFHRAAPGGMGGTKAAGNYSPVQIPRLAIVQLLCAPVLLTHIMGTLSSTKPQLLRCTVVVQLARQIDCVPPWSIPSNHHRGPMALGMR